jgi:FtsZ-interacting cell division protein ZipA
MRWVIGILVVVVLVILGYQYFGGTRGVDVAEQAQEGAQQAAQGTEEAAEATGQAVEQAAEQAAEATEQAAEQAQETAEQAAEATQEAAQQAQESAEQAAAGAQQAAEQAAEATQQAAEQAQETAEQAAAGAEQAAEEALTEAQTAALTVGDVNVGEQVTGIVKSLEETLKGVTDEQSAQAAVATLNDINGKLEQLSGTVGQLPADAKKVLADVLSKSVAGLKTMAAEVTAKEGVGTVVKSALDPIMAKLESWAQQPA